MGRFEIEVRTVSETYILQVDATCRSHAVAKALRRKHFEDVEVDMVLVRQLVWL